MDQRGRERLRRTKEILLQGWTQHPSGFEMNGTRTVKRCLLVAHAHAFNGHHLYDGTALALCQAAFRRGIPGIVAFNDHPSTKLADVFALIDEVLLELADTPHAGNADETP